ncbi:MAG: hypothetical protein DMF69_18440 [Acidobacteria bacterium]|nr:MAG: hypothetical protein DMF69_18440 [Acidobacteriota bacterium]
MNDEYLWDKSGEPDPEVQQLEQVLGRLRYQPRPLEMPDNFREARRHRYLPLLAIAATLALALLAGVVWLRARTDSKPEQRNEIAITPPSSTVNPSEKKNEEQPQSEDNSTSTDRDRKVFAVNVQRRTRRPATGLSKTERAEAIEAKKELIVALRLASEKLNLAQRRANGPATPGQIRNQHKIG